MTAQSASLPVVDQNRHVRQSSLRDIPVWSGVQDSQAFPELGVHARRDRVRLFERYRNALADVPGTRMVAEPTGCRGNYWLQTLLLDEEIQDRETRTSADCRRRTHDSANL